MWESRLGLPERAFDARMEAWSVTPSRELEQELHETAQRIGVRDLALSTTLLRRLAAALMERAESAWDAEDRAMWEARAVAISPAS